ncbi:unnamed protein product [Candidula unifasciata]|uniref:Cadherin domain-containing protein n=1 Tax=Candidula unifasciata TaxID=100452 RepID=A0A8S3ZNN6_9EUPU|nr:unnamed protein product [Candidula unifasciata]
MLLRLILVLGCLTSLCHGDIQVSTDEEVSPGTVVTRLPDHRLVFGNLTEDQILTLTYAILSQNSFPASFFKIDPKSGVVAIASRIDREEICDPIDVCSVKINIAIQSGNQALVSFSTVVSLEVIINDVNDNPPRFPARDVTLEVPEGAKVGTELKISGAIDLDSRPEFTVQHYNITPPLSTFSLRSTLNLDGSSTIALRLEKELDREVVDEYIFNIMAYDSGAHPQTDYLGVVVRVTDVNDNVPKFSRSKYEMTVNTNERPGANIGQVTATDDDVGEFGHVTYSFSSSSESVIKGSLAINSSTGWITVKGDLKTFRRSSPILLFVDARDGGQPPLGSQALVSLLVINSENNRPFIKVNTVAAADVTSLSIPESAAMDHFVAFVDVDDSDDGDNGQVACQIVSGFQFKLRSVPNKGYTLLLNASVDREQKDSYQVVISCKDGGSPSLETRVTLTVNITDVNDNTPKFSSNLYTATVEENRDPGQFITQVTALDADTGMNGELTYSLPREAQEYLRIHAKSGVITSNVPLDREKNATLRFTILVTDGGERPKTGVAEISISIKDVNDNSPQFNETKFVFSVSEQAQNNSTVGILSAFDLDIGSNGGFDFYFGGSATGEMPLPFIVLKNGSIQVTGPLDRETKGQYSFTAMVRDRGDTPRSNTAAVEIRILDENDNDPVILFPTSRNHTIIVSTTPENGMVLGRIIAYDIDEEDAAKLLYFIYDGDIDRAFSMDANTGELIVQSIEHLQNPKEYFLSIKVEDASKHPRNTTTQLRIEVLFDNTTAGMTLAQTGSSRDQYVIIVGVIGGATIVLSVIIITAIILILRSERNRHTSSDAASVKSKFFDQSLAAEVATQKLVSDLKVTKSQSSSSVGSVSHVTSPGTESQNNRCPGSMTSPGLQAKKQEDVQKKVSFSLQDDRHEQCQGQTSNNQLRVQLPVAYEGHAQWKGYNKSDDISSDTSGESGTLDSGRGTSEEDIKFDHMLSRGPPRLGDQFISTRDTSYAHFSTSTPALSRPTSGGQGQVSCQPQPDQPYILATSPTSARHGYQLQRQLPLASFAPSFSSSMRHPSIQRVSTVATGRSASPRPPGAAPASIYRHQNSITSMEDDVSTTTSGSYVINPDDVCLESYMNKDVVV